MFARVSCRKRVQVMSEPKNEQIEFGNHDKTPKPAWPWAGLLLVVLVSLLMPALLLISVRTIPAAVWGVWAMLSLWVVRDSGRLVRTNRFRVDPLGQAAVLVSAMATQTITRVSGSLCALSRPLTF